MIIKTTAKRKQTQDFDKESELEDQVMENLNTLLELKELRKRANSEGTDV